MVSVVTQGSRKIKPNRPFFADSICEKHAPQARVGFLFALLVAATSPSFAVGPRVRSGSDLLEAPEGIVVSPGLTELPEVLVDLSRSLRRPLHQGWFGIGLSCSDCVLSRDDSVSVWSFSKPPEIHYVDPDSPAADAGLRRGDVLIEIDGLPITSREGGRRFGATKPGDEVRWTYERNGKQKEVTLVASAHPDREYLMAPEVTAQVEAALADLRRKQAKVLEDLDVLRTEDLDKLRSEVWKDQVEAAREALEHASEVLRREGYAVSSEGKESDILVVPSRPQKLRYEGRLGGSEIEVLGSGSVVVTENRDDGEVLITTPEATIRIRKSK